MREIRNAVRSLEGKPLRKCSLVRQRRILGIPHARMGDGWNWFRIMFKGVLSYYGFYYQTAKFFCMK
jgi:hypothetical protein